MSDKDTFQGDILLSAFVTQLFEKMAENNSMSVNLDIKKGEYNVTFNLKITAINGQPIEKFFAEDEDEE